MLRGNVSEICQQYFKYLKFVFGPPCPRENCPGATFHVENIQRPCESSSSESEGNSQSSDDSESGTEDDANQKVIGATAANQNERRRHVIPINLDSFDPPYWCQEVDLSQNLKDWDPTLVTDEVRVTLITRNIAFSIISDLSGSVHVIHVSYPVFFLNIEELREKS
jgi:hypothetical protein